MDNCYSHRCLSFKNNVILVSFCKDLIPIVDFYNKTRKNSIFIKKTIFIRLHTK